METKVAKFFATVHQITSRKDGGGRIVLEFGCDDIDDIQWAQKVAAIQNCGFMVVMAPTKGAELNKEQDFQVDPDTGEIEI